MRDIKNGHSTINFHGNFQLPDNFQGSIADAFQLIADHLKKKDSENDVLTDLNVTEHNPCDGFEAAFRAYLEEDSKFVACVGIDTWNGEEWVRTEEETARANGEPVYM